MSDHDMVVFGILYALVMLVLLSIAVSLAQRWTKRREDERSRKDEEFKRRLEQRTHEMREKRRRGAAEHLEWMEKSKR